tara:strand:- start:180 stop:473 length:294 start_codon:yes stop_codon:yes gene_type:complete
MAVAKKSKPKAKPLSEATRKYLRETAKKYGFSSTTLAAVYRKGQGAYLSSGSRNVSMEAWARGRVRSFVTGKGGARKADANLYKRDKGRSPRMSKKK